MQRKATTPATRPPPRPLDHLISDLIEAHRSLLAATAEQRAAVRRADAAALASTREEMAAACVRISALDRERAEMVLAMAPEHPGATLRDLAAGLAEPRRSHAIELAGVLRDLVVQARRDQRRLLTATDSMLRHVRGVMHQVRRSLNHAGIYGRGGRVEPGAAVVSGIDLTR